MRKKSVAIHRTLAVAVLAGLFWSFQGSTAAGGAPSVHQGTATRGTASLRHPALGTLPATSVHSRYSEQAQQSGTAHWGTVALPPPTSGKLTTSSEKPRISPEQQALADEAAMSTRLPGAVTPAGDTFSPLSEPRSLPETTAGAPLTNGASAITIFSDHTLPGADHIDLTASTVEPSVASNGPYTLLSYNFYAALSADFGTTWEYIDPAGITQEFCCDQDVIYDPGRDLTFWLIMDTPYWDEDVDPPTTDNDGNLLHLVVFDGRDNLSNLIFTHYAIDPIGDCEEGQDEDFFNEPQMALTSNYLYILSNVFRMTSASTSTATYTCTTAIRISLDAPAQSINTEFYSDIGLFNFTAAHGGTDTLYFATHEDTNTLLVYDWPELVGPSGVGETAIEHDAYQLVGLGAYDCTPLDGPPIPAVTRTIVS